MMSDIEKISRAFDISGEVVSIEPYGNGHINDTYLLTVRDACGNRRYVLQKINAEAFKNTEALMKNFEAVTDYLNLRAREEGLDERSALQLVRALSGESHVLDRGDCWRAVLFVEGSRCYDRAESKEQLYNCAFAFGEFQRRMSGFDIKRLYETIPGFHNTPKRYASLILAAERDICNRANRVKKELNFIKQREDFCYTLERAHAEGRLPLRVTHNDTKLNNVLFDALTDKPICIIDLDTVMPGYVVNDFGDAVRYGASTANEDETELERVRFDLNLYESLAKGFIDGAGEILLRSEAQLLSAGAVMMTLECGIRFLEDYLSGDVYFKISRENHNLYRARNQLKLVSEMEQNFDKMNEIVNKYFQSRSFI